MGHPNTVLCSSLSAAWVGSLDEVSLTVVMKTSDVNDDPAPRRNRDYGCLTSFVSNDERGILRAVLRNARCLRHRL